MNHKKYQVAEGGKVALADFATQPDVAELSKSDGKEQLAAGVAKLAELQDKLHAQNTYALLIVLQGIDAAGKDGTIKHVMSGVNPAGCQVTSFKVPSEEELDHDYLWRYGRGLPARGSIGIFNRSHYEEVLVVRVRPQLLDRQRIPGKRREKFWLDRFEEINYFERYLVDNGIEVLKFFLHLSKEEQKRRFMDRLNSPDKNWKFSEGDVKERAYWDKYTEAFEDMLGHTSTKAAPWYVVPADKKWFARLTVSSVIVDKLESLKLDYPKLTGEQMQALERAKKMLENEK
ncbi:MAG: polyphosphate kinase 2 family protein [Pirellulales bacterium]